MTANPPDSSINASTFSLISSLRFDPDLPSAVRQHAGTSYPEPHDSLYYLLRYHQDRLLKAATNFQWHKAISLLQQPLEQFTQKLDSAIPDRSKAWRLRIVVDVEGRCSVDVHPATPWPLPGMFLPASFDVLASLNPSFPWRLAVDPERTAPSQFTTYKTTSRSHYDAARQRVGIQSPMDPTEVLLVNPQGEVMEGSITTVYFRRRHQNHGDATTEWVTPPLASGCMISVSRQYALDYELCTEKAIRLDELVDGEQCLLSNGVRGFIPAVLDLKAVH
ncbi:hypothetical protein UA08_06782 [Talaromyces atroroseus]|uniref:Aminodeoxychorismate lyase n=1 Tax=Talaromyces atroroseus TaxID=1441469 RepID=A0A225ATY8_TALAT|nr:hypothetical protein UA08_06782 [Talaromyces atroroseus]OKL57875.1 hypothetical protein UA08_06782 [Talaromyces atroroseus]